MRKLRLYISSLCQYSVSGIQYSVFSMRYSVFSHKSSVFSLQSSVYHRGFTLIEYLVAITILATLVGGALLTLNPFTQVERGRDAQRRQDLQQVKNALEVYYQDFNCYPETLAFGKEWEVGDSIYMKEVPQDSTCNKLNGECYQYITDTTNACPQWNVVFARLSRVPEQAAGICPLSSISDSCVPEGYNERWACVLSGAVNCTLLAASGFGYDSGTVGGDALPTPITSGPLPLPTTSPNAVRYSLGGTYDYNPYMKYMTIDPLWPTPPGIAQTFILSVEDATSDIVSAKIHLFSDNESKILTLSHSGGTVRSGTWSGTIDADTYNKKFSMAIVATNANGSSRCTVLTPGGYSAQPDIICAGINK